MFHFNVPPNFGFQFGAASGGQSITITLVVSPTDSTPAANYSSLKWAWFDEITPDLFEAPTDQGAIESTDGSGVLTIPLANTTKTSGQVGWLTITNSDGDPEQIPSAKAFSGPVAVT